MAELGSSPYINHFTQPDTIIPNPYNPQDWNRYAYARNNPLKYTDPSGHLPWLIAAGLVAINYLTFTGQFPDMKGTVLTVALADTNDATVAAGIVVQSEWLGPQDIPAVMSVYDNITGTDPGSHHYGLAQSNSSEMESLGICKECSPWELSLADDIIAARIQNGLNDCTLCDSGVDTLIVSALSQNGFDTKLFNELRENSDGTLNWGTFLNKFGWNPSDTVAKLRQGLTGDNYETELMLKLYMNDLRLLMRLGYKLPNGITPDDITEVEEIIGNYN